MSIVNLTPHPLYIRDENGEAIAVLQPSGKTARLAETASPAGTIDLDGTRVTVEVKTYGHIEGLPALPEEGTIYIVPLLTALAAKAAGRDVSDLLVPGQQTRDENGTVNGCRTLARIK